MAHWKDAGRRVRKSTKAVRWATRMVTEGLEQRMLLAATSVVDWSTYLGGNNDDAGRGIAIDGGGNAWVAGWAASTDIATGGFDTTYNGGTHDAFVAKINANGTLDRSSYLGGSGSDGATAIAIDRRGNAWVAGTTDSTDLASGGFDNSYNGGGRDDFVAKLNADGTLAWVSYLGGSGREEGFPRIAIDGDGNAWVAGFSDSTDLGSGGFDISYNGGNYDGFVAKINADGTLAWSTYLGGTGDDRAGGIGIDGSGNAWVTGSTTSPGWTSGGFDTSFAGPVDGFVAKINADGTLAWSSYLSLPGTQGNAIAIDRGGNAWVAGADALAKINANGTLAWVSTDHQGISSPRCWGIAVDDSGNAWVTGGDFVGPSGSDAFVAKISPTGTWTWVDYLGPTQVAAVFADVGYALAIDGNGSVWVTGQTYKPGWTSGGFDATYAGGGDAFVAKISNHAPVAYDQSLTTSQGVAIHGTVTAIDPEGDSLTYSAVGQPTYGTLSLQSDGTFTYTPADSYFGPDAFVYKANDGKLDSNYATVNITVTRGAGTNLSLSPSSILENQPSGTVVGTFSVSAAGGGDTFTYTLVTGMGDTDNASFSIVGNQLLSAASFDYETKNSYSIRVGTSGSSGQYFEQTFAVTVMNVNEAPTDMALSNVTVPQNQPTGLIIGTLTSTDPDAGDSFTYALVSGSGSDDNGLFRINAAQVLTAATFSLAGRTSYSIRIRTTDAGGLSFEKALSISVIDTVLSSASIPENQPYGTVVGTLSCTNPDAWNTFTYTLVPGTGGDDNGTFAIVGNQLLTEAPLNYEGKNHLSIRVRSSNVGGLVYDNLYAITITNQNESPTDISLSGPGVPEGQPIGTKVGRLTATDSDGQDTFTYALVSGHGSDDNASFRITGDRLVTATTFNYIPGREYAVRIRATDAGGLSVEKELGIPILAVFEFGRVDGRSNKNLSIADTDGDLVTFKLSGGGMGSFWGNQVGLIDTTATSTLSITVKKGRNGDGLYHLGDITSDGLLKSISAKSVVESGEVLLNSLGRSAGKATASLTFRQISDANICVQGLPVASLTVSGDVTNSRILTTGSIKKVSVATLLDSDILVGVAADCADHFATAGDFVDLSAKLESLKVTGRKLPSKTPHPAYVANSHISAPTVGTITLLNLPATSDPVVHVLTDAGTLTVTQSKLTSTPMFAPGTWKKPGQRPLIWEVVG